MNELTSNLHKTPYFLKGDSLNFDKRITICDMMEEISKQLPDKTAIAFEDHNLTFHQLNTHTNQLAHYLKNNGIKPQDKVAVFLKPGIQQIISMLALFKIGAVYIPIDSGYPEKRIQFALKDSNAALIISTTELLEKNNIGDVFTLNIDSKSDEIESLPIDYKSNTNASDIAYMMYTSGSTGVPKGVLISHLALSNHMFWISTKFDITEHDHVLHKTPVSFDPSIWELLIPFYTGSQLCIAPQGAHIDPNLLIDLIISEHITIIQLVPSVLKLLLDNKRIKRCQSLKIVFCGGETLRPEIKKLFFDKLNCNLVNLYGPTEACIDISAKQVNNHENDININSIGTSVFNTSLYVVNEQGDLQGINEEGELLIGSLSLSNGYHNRPALTHEKFIANAFEPNLYPVVYKTGDIVRLLRNGEIEYIGRNNDQIKINGVRVEPKEIVLTILQNKEISDCIIIKRVDSHGHDYLACYYTTTPHSQIKVTCIKKQLKQTFPDFMLPRTYCHMDTFPLTLNGKIDIKALPEPSFDVPISDKKLDCDVLKLTNIWQKILETNEINVEDDFFDLGGGSLLALKLITLIEKEFGVLFRIRDIYTYTTISQQLAHINKMIKTKDLTEESDQLPNPLICLQPNGNKTPLFLVHPIGGTIFWFSKLSRVLKKSRPIYGIQDPGIDLEKKIFSSIQEMALFYLKHIRKKQKKGPYLLGGASFGATIAVEMAKMLKEEGETVSAIINLDGWAIYPDTLLDNNYFKQSMQRQHDELEKDFKHYGLPCPETIFDIQWARLQLLWDYHLKLIESPMALFKSKELLPAFAEIDAPLNHWEKYSSNQIDGFEIPGNHESMFQEPHVFILAEKIEQYLSQRKL